MEYVLWGIKQGESLESYLSTEYHLKDIDDKVKEFEQQGYKQFRLLKFDINNEQQFNDTKNFWKGGK
jgi:hypothetical protein